MTVENELLPDAKILIHNEYLILIQPFEKGICCKYCYNAGSDWENDRIMCDTGKHNKIPIRGSECVCKFYEPHKGRIKDDFSPNHLKFILRYYKELIFRNITSKEKSKELKDAEAEIERLKNKLSIYEEMDETLKFMDKQLLEKGTKIQKALKHTEDVLIKLKPYTGTKFTAEIIKYKEILEDSETGKGIEPQPCRDAKAESNSHVMVTPRNSESELKTCSHCHEPCEKIGVKGKSMKIFCCNCVPPDHIKKSVGKWMCNTCRIRSSEPFIALEDNEVKKNFWRNKYIKATEEIERLKSALVAKGDIHYIEEIECLQREIRILEGKK